jgi:hypothetical protein
MKVFIMEFQYYLKRESEPPVTLAVYGRPLEGAEVLAFSRPTYCPSRPYYGKIWTWVLGLCVKVKQNSW